MFQLLNKAVFFIFQNKKTLLIFVAVLALLGQAQAGFLGVTGYGACQTCCNKGWVICVAKFGAVAGVPAAIGTCCAAAAFVV